jgi:hypothetical protein
MEKEEILKSLEGYVELKDDSTTIKDNSDITRVKWGEIEKLGHSNLLKKEEIMSSLKDLNILSSKARGNYGVICGVGNLNPLIRDNRDFRVLDYSFFTREEDAINYKSDIYSHSQYTVNVIKYID